jgi:hypothetical protein
MTKLQTDHRVVIRDQNDRIVLDEKHPHFAAASPAFEAQKAHLPEGHVLTLQHGARVIKRWPE